MTTVVMMTHAFLGLLVLLTSLWVLVEALNLSQANIGRIRGMSLLPAVLMWLTLIVGGYWYVVYYGAEKALTLKGPWPFAHEFYMETKEHVVLMVLLLTTFLPIVARDDLVGNRAARNLLVAVAGLIVVLAIVVEGSGGIIAMGSKLAVMPK